MGQKLIKSKIVKITLFFIAFTFLLFLSELVYRINNRPEPTLDDYIRIASNSAQKSRVQKALKNLGKAAEIKLKSEIAYEYPDMNLDDSFVLTPLPDNNKLKKDFAEYLKTVDYEQLSESYATKWSKPFYSLGLIAFQNNELDLMIPFWEIGVNLAPELSYLHVELANFYLTQDNINKATSTIDYCLTFEHPRDHCIEFLYQNIKLQSPSPVGTWEAEINDILSSN